MKRKHERRVMELRTTEIRPNPWQPRKHFEEEGLRELAVSIADHGILQPLTVRRGRTGWELIAGERRLRAAKLAGLETVPCIETEADDQKSALLALVENLQRQDLHFFEEATAIADYLRWLYDTEKASDALILKESENALDVEIAYCPAVKHLLSRDIIPHESFVATTSVVYETIAKESGFGFEMRAYDHATGAASFRFFKA